MSDSVTTTLQIRVKEHTLGQLDRLQLMTHAPSRSDAIRRAVEMGDYLINAIMRGDRIIVENKRGAQRQIVIPGLNASDQDE